MGDPGDTGASDDPHALLPLALSRPGDAVAAATALLERRPPPLVASIAHQAVAVVQRDHGDLAEAVRGLRRALRYARRSGSAEREDDVLATLGVTLVYAGRTGPGLAALDAAAGRAGPTVGAQILVRRGIALWTAGRHLPALRDLDQAVAALHRHDEVWEARALTARAFTHLALGDTASAGTDLADAERMLAASDRWYGSAVAVHNRGLVAFRSGDLPAALDCLDRAAAQYRALDVVVPDLAIDRCAVLLAAGLARDAVEEAVAGVAWAAGRGQATKRAELVLLEAQARLAVGDPAAAGQRAADARRMFARQQRPWWAAHARLLELRARATGAARPGPLYVAVRACRDELAALGSPDLDLAHLLLGEAAARARRPAEAAAAFDHAARARHGGPPLVRATGWLARARLAAARNDRRRVLHACRRGLQVIDEHRWSLGSSELRAQASAHGTELARLAQHQVLAHGSPRDLLRWSERWRACALAVPPARSPDDPVLGADLAALREIGARLAGQPGAGGPDLRREQRRLERAVRARALRLPGAGAGGVAIDVDELLQELGGRCLLQIVEIDGLLHVLVCSGGRVQRFPAGSCADAGREVEFARAALNRIARGRGRNGAGVLLAGAARLSAVLLGAARRYLGDGPVVVVPPGNLQAVPWGLLPELAGSEVTVSPSAASWVRASRASAPRPGGLVLVRGPGLDAVGSEVDHLALLHPAATVLRDGTATVGAVLAALDRADTAHIAAHGTFRSDSPMFSALHVDDGPLTVHDLERLAAPPRRVILASCDSGLHAAAGDELLGLTSALLPAGTTGIVAGLVRVDDAASARLMTDLHAGLAAGASLAAALCRARRAAGDDPVAVATAASYACLGAG